MGTQKNNIEPIVVLTYLPISKPKPLILCDLDISQVLMHYKDVADALNNLKSAMTKANINARVHIWVE